MESNHVLTYLAIVSASILWGTSYTVVKIGLSNLSPPLPPLGFLALRFLLALLFSIPILVSETAWKNVFSLLTNKYIAVLGIINGIAYSLQFLGQLGTTVAITTIMINTYLISTPLFSAIMQKEKITKTTGLAVLSGMTGVLIVSGSILLNDVPPEDMLIFLSSTVLVFFSGFIWGSYAVISSVFYKEAEILGIEEKDDALAVFVSSNLYSLLIISALMLILKQGLDSEKFTIEVWLVTAYLALFCTVIPFTLYIFASQSLQPTELNIILMVNIVVSLIIANLILLEDLTMFGITGCCLIFFSIYIANSKYRKTIMNKK